MARNCNELSLLYILLIFKRLQNPQTPPTSILISSDQHINIFRAGTYFPPSWKVRSWSPREAAPGDQERLALVAVELFLRNVRINLTFRLACTIFVKSVVTFSYGIIQSLPLDMGMDNVMRKVIFNINDEDYENTCD